MGHVYAEKPAGYFLRALPVQLSEVGQILSEMKTARLETLDAGDPDVRKAVLSSYQTLSYPGGRELCGDVGAAKALHFVYPRLFPMWDNPILRHEALRPHLKAKGIRRSAEGYFAWFTAMSAQAKSVVESTPLSGDDALDFLSIHYPTGERKSLAKLLDEYYYSIYSRRWTTPPD